eukprot:1136360-Pelagomonas_calceolata.AAC.3
MLAQLKTKAPKVEKASIMLLSPLPGNKAALMLSLCALSKDDLPTVGTQGDLDPTEIPPQDRDIHLVEFEFCPDTNPFPTLEAAHHASSITRLKTRSTQNLNRNNKVTLHVKTLLVWQAVSLLTVPL